MTAHHDIAYPSIDIYRSTSPEEAHRAIAELRATAPTALGPFGLEVLSYDHVRAVLRDPRFVMPTGGSLAAQGVTSGKLWDRVCTSVVGIDGWRHQRIRRVVARAFTPKSADRLRASCVSAINDLVDRYVSSGSCDVVDIAREYPVSIICGLLGVDRDDWAQLARWVRGISKAFGPFAASNEAAIVDAWEHLDAYLDVLVARRRSDMGDDLLSELIRAEDAGSRLSYEELLSMIAVLLVAGTDTTSNQLAAAVAVLAKHPFQWELIGAQPAFAAQAVAEVMRHSPVSFSVIRVASSDVELDGVVIAEGTFVVASTASANRDPAVYDDPDRFDVTRSGAPPMLTFGGGAHHCLGAHLARVELTEALALMAQRMPNVRLTGPAPWRPLLGITGPITVPIAFDRD